MKEIPMSEGFKNIVESTISSYEERMQHIGDVFDAAHQILQGFQESFTAKQERDTINARLRESFAKNGSMRKKDFDGMMRDILLAQDEREKEARDILSGYLDEQKETAKALKENLQKIRDSLAGGEVRRVHECHEMMKDILAGQDERKEWVTSRLKEFQEEQKLLSSRLKGILAKGKEIRAMDLKLMLDELKAQGRQRKIQTAGRRDEVRTMLDKFKEQRL
ncbi:MAG: hypothetical protein ABIJ56_05895 [Pseudomonadota bacterium]